MERLFNLHTAESARGYVFHHPEDERYVPVNLPEPDLVNIKPMGGLVDMDFDGEPLFAPDGREGRRDTRGSAERQNMTTSDGLD